MTKDDFLHLYYDWITQDESAAEREAACVNDLGIDDGAAVAVEMPGVGWSLMLKESAEFLRDGCGFEDLRIEGESV